MKVIDTRIRWLGIELGDERIALSREEVRLLRRASALLRKIRDLRASEYHRRGYAPTEGLAADVADDADNRVLAGADAFLDEFLDQCADPTNHSMRVVLPVMLNRRTLP